MDTENSEQLEVLLSNCRNRIWTGRGGGVDGTHIN